MNDHDPLVKERLRKNLMAWSDITAFCLELRKSYLKSKYSSMDDNDLIKKLFAEDDEINHDYLKIWSDKLNITLYKN